MNIIRILIVVAGLIPALLSEASAQQPRYLSIVPSFHSRPGAVGRKNQLQLLRQEFVLFLYRNAVVVHSSAQFVNTGEEPFEQEFALPSTGHDENGRAPRGRISNGILGVVLNVEGERIAPKIVRNGDGDWYTIRATMDPGVPHRIEALFWAETSLSDVDSLPGLDSATIALGKRGLLIDLAHAGAWNDLIRLVNVTVVLRGGMSVARDSFAISPKTYETADSTLSWTFLDIEPSQSDNIEISYSPAGPWGTAPNTMAALSAYIMKKAYDELTHVVEAR